MLYLVFNFPFFCRYSLRTTPDPCTSRLFFVIKALARKNYHAAGRHIMGHPQLKKLVQSELGRLLRSELKEATSVGSTSVINRADAASIRSFSWEALKDDLALHCKQLLNFLQLCVPQHKREQAGGVLSMIIAMLAKFTNQRARLVQTVLSLVLMSGHATKQVGYKIAFNE